MPAAADTVDADPPCWLRHASRLVLERRGRLAQVRQQLGGWPPGTGLDCVVTGLQARVLRGHHARPRPDEQVTQPVRVAGEVTEDMPAAPAGQQRGLPCLAVGEPGGGAEQAAGRLRQPGLQFPRVVSHGTHPVHSGHPRPSLRSRRIRGPRRPDPPRSWMLGRQRAGNARRECRGGRGRCRLRPGRAARGCTAGSRPGWPARWAGRAGEAPAFCQTPRIRWTHPPSLGDLPPLTAENSLPDPGEQPP